MRILLVEDHRDTCEAISRMLSRIGCEVETAANVADATHACKNCTYDLLLCDIGLPDGDGWELLRNVRQFSPVPGIALTGYGMPAEVQTSIESGFAAHITKP